MLNTSVIPKTYVAEYYFTYSCMGLQHSRSSWSFVISGKDRMRQVCQAMQFSSVTVQKILRRKYSMFGAFSGGKDSKEWHINMAMISHHVVIDSLLIAEQSRKLSGISSNVQPLERSSGILQAFCLAPSLPSSCHLPPRSRRQCQALRDQILSYSLFLRIAL